LRTVAYCTGLYSKQAYCQEERVEAFNKAEEEARKAGLTLEVQIFINNSPKEFFTVMAKLYKKDAKFQHFLTDLGKMDYWKDVPIKNVKAVRMDMHRGSVERIEGWDEGGVFSARTFDIYKLLAEIFNKGMTRSYRLGHEFFGILSGDQILPPEHPATMVRFLDEHPEAGIASALAFYDFSKKKMLIDGEEREALRPLVYVYDRPGRPNYMRWVYDNLLPNEKNNWTGLAFVEVDAVGTGGSLIPRKVFGKLKFKLEHEEGIGEDIQYCLDIQRAGYKVYSIPEVIIKNRYESGELY